MGGKAVFMNSRMASCASILRKGAERHYSRVPQTSSLIEHEPLVILEVEEEKRLDRLQHAQAHAKGAAGARNMRV
jgi:hypothetical protein